MVTKVSSFVFALSFVTATSCLHTSEVDIKKIIEGSKVSDVFLAIDNSVRNDYCKTWAMTPEEIKDFFSRANLITGEQRHSLYDWGGCDIEGDFIFGSDRYHFTINAGGTAYIQFGDGFIFGCMEACADIFDFGFYKN